MASNRRSDRITVARLWMRENIITAVLVVFIILSLLLHAVTLGSLWRVRSVIRHQLDISTAQLAEVRQQTVRYNFPVDQTFTIDTTVAISETVEVPLSLTVPISQEVSIPIETFLGTVPITVPLDLTIPVSETIEVPINRDLPFQTDIPIQTEFPIEIRLSEPPLGDVLKQFEEALQELRNRL